MKFLRSLAFLAVCVLASHAFAQATQPTEVTKIIKAVESTERWNGWAKDSRSRPGWGNVPPEAGTVTIVPGEAKQPRTFSGRVEGLADLKGAEVAVVSLDYVYWMRRDETFHWSPVADDGTFSITEDKLLDENKSIMLRAPNQPITVFSYIFKAPEGGKDIVLKAEPGKAVRVTVEVAGEKSDSFNVDLFSLNRAWIHENNPAGYHWASHQWTPEKSDGSITVYLPLRPIGAYIVARGAAAEWQVLDAREADHFHLVLQPAARFVLTVVKDGVPVPNVPILTGNENAAFSNQAGKTDEKGCWEAHGMAAGTWWMDVNEKTVEYEVESAKVTSGTFDVSTNKLVTTPPEK